MDEFQSAFNELVSSSLYACPTETLYRFSSHHIFKGLWAQLGGWDLQ